MLELVKMDKNSSRNLKWPSKIGGITGMKRILFPEKYVEDSNKLLKNMQKKEDKSVIRLVFDHFPLLIQFLVVLYSR